MATTRLSNDEILLACKRVFETHGENLTAFEVSKLTGISVMVLQTRFGRWRDLRVRLGFEPRRVGATANRIYSRELLLERFREVTERIGDDITFAKFCREAKIGPNSVAIYFGNWGELRQAAGLPRRARRKAHLSDKALMADLMRVYFSLKGPEPTKWDYDRLGAACSATLLKRFGPRWHNVLSAMYAFRRWMRTEYPDRDERDAKCWEWIRTLTKVRPATGTDGDEDGGRGS